MKKTVGFVLILLSTAQLSAQEGQFNFILDERGNKTIFDIRTVELFPCQNYGIRLFHHFSGETLFVDIRDFFAPEPCVGGMDVASARREIPTMGSDTTMIVIRWNGQTDRWRVLRRSTELKAEGIRPSFTSWLR